ncbi:hypothetical protein Tco_0034121 [Tanacetum coccineum]
MHWFSCKEKSKRLFPIIFLLSTPLTMKGKSVDTKFAKSYVVRQPNAFRFQKPSILGKSSPFANSLERQSFPESWFIPKTNKKNDFSKPITPQILPKKETENKAVKNTKRVNHTNSVSRPQHRALD